MSTQKRALASASSGQASLLKRPRTARMNQAWHRSKRNHMPRSWWTEQVVRRVVREEWECAKSDLAEFCRSFMRSALEDIMQQTSSMQNAFQKPMGTLELANNHSPNLGWANAKSTGKNDVRNLRLQIQTKLSDPLFTGKKLAGEGGACISVALIDANTGNVVRSGPEYSIKLDVVVLEGDFNKDDEDNWALGEFEKYMVKERERKGPLLTGDLQVTLKEGVGELGELIFTDNSSWSRNKKFRIGLKVASGYCGNTRIREAITDAFRVKDRRGESNKKHYPPASDDEVWRLEKIAKDGISHRKLSEAGIHKVEDFLQRLAADSKNLREVLGKSMTPKNWESLVKHARACKNWRPYLDYPNGMREHAAVLNTHGQKTGLTEDTEPGDTKAVDNWNDVRGLNGETFSGTMQKKSSSTFPSQVFEGQTENLIPVQWNSAPRTCAAPVVLEAPLANAGSTVEGHNGATALPWPAQSQNTDCGVAAIQFSADGSVPLPAHHPIYADRLNVSYSPGDNAITAVGSPMQPWDMIPQLAMPMYIPMLDHSSPMYFTVDELDLFSVHPHDPMPSCQWSSALPRPEGNPSTEDSQLNIAGDWENFWSANHSSC